jgi:hypothetical protein
MAPKARHTRVLLAELTTTRGRSLAVDTVDFFSRPREANSSAKATVYAHSLQLSHNLA